VPKTAPGSATHWVDDLVHHVYIIFDELLDSDLSNKLISLESHNHIIGYKVVVQVVVLSCD